MKKIVVTFGGESLIKEYDLYGYRRGVREKVCYHLRWGKPFRNLGLYGYRRGGTFDSPKVPKSDLGLRPKNPRTGTPARKVCDGGPRKVARPCGERRAHRSGEGCP